MAGSVRAFRFVAVLTVLVAPIALESAALASGHGLRAIALLAGSSNPRQATKNEQSGIRQASPSLFVLQAGEPTMCQRWDIDVYAATPHLAYAMVSTVWSKNPSCIQFIALGDGAYFFVGHGRTWRSLGSGGGALQCQQTVDGIPLAAMDAFLCSRTELRATESCTPFAAQEAMASQFPTESSLLQSYEDPVTGKLVNPVIVTCRDVTHDGVPDMIARISSGGSAGIGAWEVFTKSRGHWRWIGGSLKDGSTDLQVLPNEEIQMTTAGIFRNGDAHCCPSGGWVHARYRWNGSAFVVVKRWTIRT